MFHPDGSTAISSMSEFIWLRRLLTVALWMIQDVLVFLHHCLITVSEIKILHNDVSMPPLALTIGGLYTLSMFLRRKTALILQST